MSIWGMGPAPMQRCQMGRAVHSGIRARSRRTTRTLPSCFSWDATNWCGCRNSRWWLRRAIWGMRTYSRWATAITRSCIAGRDWRGIRSLRRRASKRHRTAVRISATTATSWGWTLPSNGKREGAMRMIRTKILFGTLAMVILAMGSATGQNGGVSSGYPTPKDGFNQSQQRGHGLYLRYCVGCHGTYGDGNGENAPYIDPKPRDFVAGTVQWPVTPT